MRVKVKVPSAEGLVNAMLAEHDVPVHETSRIWSLTKVVPVGAVLRIGNALLMVILT